MTMTIAFYCVLIGAVMPLFWTGYAKFSAGRYNNFKPRDFQAKMEGKQQRAHWAHLNAFEAFPPFAAAVIIAHLVHGPSAWLNYLAIAWVVMRLIYGFLYIFNRAYERTTVWMLATACWVAMFFL
jgi:uncharacterized MAPEG superfamily protein